MKILTANFVTCAVQSCKSSPASFPLHFQEAELESSEMEYSPAFLTGILPRIEWDALRVTAQELGFTTLPETKPDIAAAAATATHDDDQMGEGTGKEVGGADEQILKDLHKLLLETSVSEGKLVCGNCGHEYRIKEGIANFLLPSHLV